MNEIDLNKAPTRTIRIAIAANVDSEGNETWTAHGADCLTDEQAAACVSHHGGPPVQFVDVEVPEMVFTEQVGRFEVMGVDLGEGPDESVAVALARKVDAGLEHIRAYLEPSR